jgi:hypothetical protein
MNEIAGVSSGVDGDGVLVVPRDDGVYNDAKEKTTKIMGRSISSEAS